MGDFTVLQGSKVSPYSGGTYVTSVATSSTANTKGVWVDIDAATDLDHDAFQFMVRGDTNELILVDIGIGAASSEQVIVPDIMCQSGSFRNASRQVFPVPISIPSGTRLSARAQVASTGTEAAQVFAHGISGGFSSLPKLSRVTNYGSDTSDSTGVQVDPGAAADTKGAYSELTGSTTNPIKWMIVLIGLKANTAPADAVFLLDIAIGAATSETVVIPDISMRVDPEGEMIAPPNFWCPMSVPSGTRLAARAQCNITDGTDRLIDVVILGVD